MTVHTERLVGARTSPWAWLGIGFLVGFAVPYVFSDVLGMQRDLYYAVHASATVMLFAAWLRHEGRTLASFVSHRWRWGVLAGAAGAVVTVFAALASDDATSRPDGIDLAAAIAWRGVVYGASDGLLLAVFPIVVVYAALESHRRRVLGKTAVGFAALIASLAMTTVYHVGYPEYRDADLARPMGGNVAWSLPTIVTASPLASPIAHAAMHVTAVVHSYDTDVLLPPHEQR